MTEREVIKYGQYAKEATVKGWLCTKCNRFFVKDEYMASICCSNTQDCEKCGSPTSEKHWRICDDCRRMREAEKMQKRLDEAELVKWDGGMIVCEDIGYDGFFNSPEDLVEYCEDEGIAVPEFAFACKPNVLSLDLGRILEDAEELIEWNSGEWGEPCYGGLSELQTAIDAFNAVNTSICSWWADYKRKVRVR